MTSVKESNNTHAADDIEWHVSQINYLYQWQFVNHDPRILNRRHGAVAIKIGHLVEPVSLSSVGISSSPWSVNKDSGKQLSMHDVM